MTDQRGTKQNIWWIVFSKFQDDRNDCFKRYVSGTEPRVVLSDETAVKVIQYDEYESVLNALGMCQAENEELMRENYCQERWAHEKRRADKLEEQLKIYEREYNPGGI